MCHRIFILSFGVALVLSATPQAVSQAAASQPPVSQPSAVFVAIYERGPAWDDTKSALAQSRIQDHMMYLRANMETLVGAAPFQQGMALGSQDRSVGMVIVAAANEEQAHRFVAADPAVASGIMKTTVRRWLVDRVKAF